VPGGIETLIQGLLQATGPEGTLLLPALSWALRPPEVFNPASTPTNVGAVPEFFRTRTGTLRSIHPTHSVCAVGRGAHAMLDDHGLDCTPCGAHSPFRKITEMAGRIVMLGCGLCPNTTMHAIEELADPPYLYGPSCVFTITDARGGFRQKEYRTHGFACHGFQQRYDRVTQLDAGSFLTTGKVLQADACVLDAPALRQAVLAKLREDNSFFVEARPAST
jgi:aminoglycoside 3-N-acetyltransferase